MFFPVQSANLPGNYEILQLFHYRILFSHKLINMKTNNVFNLYALQTLLKPHFGMGVLR